MIILSYHNIRVPFFSAHSLYTVQTSIDLSKLGEVFFYANGGDADLDFKSLYGMDLLDYPAFHLKTTRLKHKGLAGLEKRIMVLRDLGTFTGNKMIVYVTQVRPLRYFLFLKRLGFKIKIVLEPHSEREPWDRMLLTGVNGIIFSSRTLQSKLTERFSIPPEIPKEVLYHRIRRPFSRETHSPGPDKNSYCIGYIGGLESWKGVDTIVEALKYLPESVRAYFIGGGKEGVDYKRMMFRAKEVGVEDRVQHKEYVPFECLERMVEGIDAFILPLLESQEGSLPMKLFDYMYFKKPIVASNQESIKEVLKNGASALFFSPGSGKRLAEQVKTLMEDYSLSHDLSVNAYKSVESYTVDRWLEVMKVFLERI